MTQGGVCTCPRLAQPLLYEMLAVLGFQAHLLSMPHASTAADCRRSCNTQSTRLGHDAVAAAILVSRCLLANAAVIHEYVLCCITHSHRARIHTLLDCQTHTSSLRRRTQTTGAQTCGLGGSCA
jgi:hypothetical protein